MWYTIESTEDWLSRLAIRFLGDVNQWTEIYEVNKAVIGPDPNKIRVGMKLWIPVGGAAKPAESSSSTTVSEGATHLSRDVVATPSVFNQPSVWAQTSPQGVIDPNVVHQKSPMNTLLIYGGIGLASVAALMMMTGNKRKTI